MTIATRKLTDSIGAEVTDVDLNRMANDPDVPKTTLEPLEEHGILVFHELGVDDAAEVAFSKQLGSVEVLGKGDHPEIFRVTLDPAKNPMAPYLRGTFDWHIDGMTDDIPITTTILSAHAVADVGGETEFSSSYAVYDDLDADDKERFGEIRVLHTVERAQRLVNDNPPPEELARWRRRPSKVHPLMLTHRSGRKSLVLGATADSGDGMTSEDSRRFLDGLLARATDPARVYRQAWSVGDMVIWDNRGVLHRASAYDSTLPRDMHRTTLCGDERIQ